MAIPIYVPEEYGPLPPSPSQPSTSTNCPSAQSPGCSSRASFLHLLIEELYAIYQEYCANAAAASNQPSVPESNNNVSCIDFNNSNLELHCSRRFGPRVNEIKSSHTHEQVQPESRLGKRSHQLTMVLVPVAAASPSHSHNRSKPKSKRSSWNGNNIGSQLRQVADTFEENHAVNHHVAVPKSSSVKLSWRIGRESMISLGSLLFATGAAVTLFLTRHK